MCPALPRLVIAWAALLAVGCELELAPEESPVGESFAVIGSNVARNAVGVPRNQPLSLAFNRYLDPDAFAYFNAMSLRSGGVRASGFTRYSPATRTLTFYPVRNLEPGLIYELRVDEELVTSIQGEALEDGFSLRFQSARDGTTDEGPFLEPVSFAESVEPLFIAGCGCHYERPELLSLDYESLVGRPSSQRPARALVEPFDPARSYLLQKVLPSYPDRRFDIMPPPWSGLPRLERADLEVLENWIETGARE